MKFPLDCDSYTGHDLIFLVGAPGSRWSSIYLHLSQHVGINNSDLNHDQTWSMSLQLNTGQQINIGNHRGAYWGPGCKYGANFDRLNTLTKQELVAEFQQGFDSWDKIKIIKSHWFSYHIDYLHNLFPDAKIVLCYANDIDCFYWWHKCGGWGIAYPNYSWYRDDQTMLLKIKEENYNILRFSRNKKIDFAKKDLSWLCDRLGLDHNSVNNVALKTEVAVCTSGPMTDFDHLTP